MFPEILDGAKVLYYTPHDDFGDSLWDSIEMCMGVANSSHGGQVIWIEKE